MIAKFSVFQLRALQILLLALVLGSIFLPWFSFSIHLQGGPVVAEVTSGWSLNIAWLMVTLATGSVLISILECIVSRATRFFHAALFVITLLVGVVIHLVPMIPGVSQYRVAWGGELCLLVALVLFPVSAMLAPGVRAPTQE